ncbi:hypothetical protein K5Q02_18785 [Pseudomonas sp. MM211]|uniref:hypothetical protein n=1 Tax=Pseudomonas sp. MM211 TaxID=2866808 RepID=UPI001CEC913D|nr:hypothetical protein [Pseudomonas sp. MM211]UCJ15859.1 hypothetical protein K5Q02_18785 [Pseudomonas sp. MM211]
MASKQQRMIQRKRTWADRALLAIPGVKFVTSTITSAAHQAVRSERLIRASIIFKSPTLIGAAVGIVILVSMGKWNHYILAAIAAASALADLYYKYREILTRHQMARLTRKVGKLQRLSERVSDS